MKLYSLIFVLLFGFLAVFFTQIFLGARLFSVAMDEQIHLPAGFVHLQTKEIEFRKSNAPLVGMLAALPSFLFSKIDLDVNDPDILNNNFWDFGNKFLFSNNAEQIVFSGRMIVAILATLMASYVFKWASDIFGYKSGLFALFLFIFIPTVTAHSQLVSTDVGLAAFLFISAYYFWKSLKQSKLRDKVLAGIFMGMALGAKFSGILLLPIFILFALAATLNGSRSFNIKNFLHLILPVFVVGFLFLWTIYFFPLDLNFYSEGFKSIYVEDANTNYPVYLNGNFQKGGWWYYFLEGFLIKTPIPFLILLIWSLFWFKKFKTKLLDKIFLLMFPVVIFFFTSYGAHNLGVRYLIPVYPFLAVYIGGLMGLVQNSKIKVQNDNLKFKIFSISWQIPKFYILIFVFLILSSWYLFTAITTYPNQLAYFNEFVGGPDNGYKYMDDSNIDWGHDLKRLKRFTDSRPDAKVVYIWRQGKRALDYYGIGKEKNLIDIPESWWQEPKGVYALSSHFLVRAKITSQVYKEPLLDWMSLYKPKDRIGQSFFIYEF